MSTEVLCPFSKCVVIVVLLSLLLLSCINFLYILDVNPVPDKCFAHIFPTPVFFVFWGPYLQHTGVPRLGVESELYPPAFATATATQDLSLICDLHSSSRQHWILRLLSEARDWTCMLMDTSQICFHWAMTGIPQCHLLKKPSFPHHVFSTFLSVISWPYVGLFLALYSVPLIQMSGVFFWWGGSFLATLQHMVFLGQGSDLSHSCDLHHSCGNSASLIHSAGPRLEPMSQCSRHHWSYCATMETPCVCFYANVILFWLTL